MRNEQRWTDINPDLILTFFFEFSRFEYALKRAGYLQDTTAAKPDWTRFGQDIAPLWDRIQGDPFRSACDYLTAHPPKKQVRENEALTWASIHRDSYPNDASFVLVCVRTVRNNLFHGGKYPEGPVSPPERDEQLIQSALSVLRGVGTVSTEIREYFESEG